jgi:hypothetical protein
MATAKKTTKKSSTTKSKRVPMRSLRPSAEESPFLTFRVTAQSVYWLIVSLLILALGVWVVTLSVKVQDLYDQIETTSAEVIIFPKTKNS